MSWAGITSSQIVSEANLADACNTGVFAARIAIPITGRELTTTAATTAAIVSVTAGRASNQLVTKGSLSPLIVGPGPYNYYVYGTDGISAFKSTNGGFTFVELNTGVFFCSCIAASYSGTYIAVGSKGIANTIYVSSNSGSSFSAITIGNTTGAFTSFFPINVAMSSDGQYMAIVGKSTSGSNYGYVTVAISTNYGVSFSVYNSTYISTLVDTCAVAVSANGQYITFISSTGVGNASYRGWSINYGSSFSLPSASTSQRFSDIAISSTGQYQLISDFNGNGFVSSNYGSSFTQRLVTYAISGKYCGMTDNGAVMGIYMTTGSYFESTNYGVTWDYTTYTPPASCIGLGFSTDYPSSSNYIAIFQPTYCNYKPAASTTFYAQPLGYNMSSLSNIYKKAINY